MDAKIDPARHPAAISNKHPGKQSPQVWRQKHFHPAAVHVDIFAAIRKGREAVDYCLNLQDSESVKAKDGSGKSPLHVVAQEGNRELVVTFLVADADVNATDNFGSSALHYAAQQDHVDIAKDLLEAKADVNMSNESGETPLHTAVWKGQTAMVEVLMAANADPAAKNQIGESAISYAERKHIDAITKLICGDEAKAPEPEKKTEDNANAAQQNDDQKEEMSSNKDKLEKEISGLKKQLQHATTQLDFYKVQSTEDKNVIENKEQRRKDLTLLAEKLKVSIKENDQTSLLSVVADCFMVIFFCYSSAVQLNDPDWEIWVSIYLACAVLTLLHVFQVVKKVMVNGTWIVLAACLGGLALQYRINDWKSDFSVDTEIGRESCGLLIMIGWLAGMLLRSETGKASNILALGVAGVLMAAIFVIPQLGYAEVPEHCQGIGISPKTFGK